MPRFHVSEVRNAVYCGRQAYYESQREACRLPSPETRVVHELAYSYPTLVKSPEDALRRAEETADVSVSLDLSEASDSLAEARDEYELWDAVARPDREERYIESERLRGTVDKLSFRDGGVVVSLVKTGTPPTDGVWSSERVETAALHELVSPGHDVRCTVVEYPRVGALRRVDVGRDDERALERALETLEDIKKGVPPSRTDNRSKCESCDFKEECGVETKSVLTRLKERFG
ncbi:MAG: Dna2/Cas4 domain-containing protein [Halobacteriales archaeon]|nr:Dna2/Cas4 domain-containing protein [Halobacteriales archaeon]